MSREPTPADGDPRLFFNGLRDDGSYVQPPMEAEELGRRLLGLPRDWKDPVVEDDRGHDDPTRSPMRGVDANDLDSAGWAVVFPAGCSLKINRALDELCDLRASQTRYFKSLLYSPGENIDDFLGNLQAPRGLADPRRLPYYVLLVGGPEEIPYEFQYELDQVYAVGRISFDSAAEYACYAKSVVNAEEGRVRRRREVAFFAPEHAGDRATRRTRRDLAQPLSDHVAAHDGWSVQRHLGSAADKTVLTDVLGGDSRPALLFAAGHGLQVDAGAAGQRERQGALVTAEWQGKGRLGAESYFAAADLAQVEATPGVIAFLFACYSAGTPRYDSFWDEESKPKSLAPSPFVAALAQRLLTAPQGGALAVVGHVDRAWTTSFDPYQDGGQRAVFECVLDSLLAGDPVGGAMDYFDQLTGDMSLRLSNRFERRVQRRSVDLADFARTWIAHNDARNFVVFGDPAVRLAVPVLR